MRWWLSFRLSSISFLRIFSCRSDLGASTNSKIITKKLKWLVWVAVIIVHLLFLSRATSTGEKLHHVDGWAVMVEFFLWVEKLLFNDRFQDIVVLSSVCRPVSSSSSRSMRQSNLRDSIRISSCLIFLVLCVAIMLSTTISIYVNSTGEKLHRVDLRGVLTLIFVFG